MDPSAFAIVKSEVRRLPFIDDKIQAVVYAQGNLYGEQLGDLLMNDVGFDDDRMRFLQSAAAKMLPASCLGIITILNAFRSGSKKVQAVQLLARQITDPMNFHVWNAVFPYAQERDTVRGIMTRQASTVPPAPPASVPVVGNPYPYGRPKPRVNPDDPYYQLADKTVDVVANVAGGVVGGIASAFSPRHRPGVVMQRPGVSYQTTTVTNYPTASVSNPAPGVQVIQTGPPPPPGTVQYVIGAQPPLYPQQQYYRKY